MILLIYDAINNYNRSCAFKHQKFKYPLHTPIINLDNKMI